VQLAACFNERAHVIFSGSVTYKNLVDVYYANKPRDRRGASRKMIFLSVNGPNNTGQAEIAVGPAGEGPVQVVPKTDSLVGSLRGSLTTMVAAGMAKMARFRSDSSLSRPRADEKLNAFLTLINMPVFSIMEKLLDDQQRPTLPVESL
jgi:hypothetical protein